MNKKFWIGFSIFIFLCTQSVFADELTDLKKQMQINEDRHREEIQMLQKRIENLETQAAKASALSAAPVTNSDHPANIEERMSRIEKLTEPLTKPTAFYPYWKEGIRMDSPNGAFKMKIGGRIKDDWVFNREDNKIHNQIGNQEDGTEMRSARLYIAGTIYDRYEFKGQYEFAGGTSQFKDVYLGITKIPVVGNIRVGQYTQPFSLEEATSSRFETFMEPGLPNAFVPSKKIGGMLYRNFLDERIYSAVSLFRNTDDTGGTGTSGDGDYAESARIATLPWYENDGHFWEIGGSYSHQNNNNNTLRIRSRPESHLASNYVDTGNFTASSMELFGTESAVVLGPLSFQGEFIGDAINAQGVNDPFLKGFYVYGSYFLTGEHRVYDRAKAEFDRIKPKKNFFGSEKGLGAWEAALRYSSIDLSEKLVSGGELWDLTAGLNWYLNPNMRIFWNYIFSDRNSIGASHILQTRFQIDF